MSVLYFTQYLKKIILDLYFCLIGNCLTIGLLWENMQQNNQDLLETFQGLLMIREIFYVTATSSPAVKKLNTFVQSLASFGLNFCL